MKSWQDGSKDLYVAGHATTVQVTNYPLIILTGNTGSPAEAFTCSPSPGDAKRVYPLYFGGCEGEDTGHEERAKAARELGAACKADRAGILLQYLALMVDYAKVPLANHKHAWPIMPCAPLIAGPGDVVTAWCEANAERFKEGADDDEVKRGEVWNAMADSGQKRPRDAKGPACNVYADALNAYMHKRFKLAPRKGRSASYVYPGVVLMPTAKTKVVASVLELRSIPGLCD